VAGHGWARKVREGLCKAGQIMSGHDCAGQGRAVLCKAGREAQAWACQRKARQGKVGKIRDRECKAKQG
jgi:hypothetical protein